MPRLVVPRSWRAPHGVGSEEDGFVFPVRVNGRTAFMPYSEVQKMFLGFYEKRQKLSLVKSELSTIANAMKELGEICKDEARWWETPGTFAATVLETTLADTYSITWEHTSFTEATTELRDLLRHINAATEVVRLRIGSEVAAHDRVVRDQRSRLATLATDAQGKAKRAIEATNKILAL